MLQLSLKFLKLSCVLYETFQNWPSSSQYAYLKSAFTVYVKNLRIYLVLKSVINSGGKWNFALRFSWTCSYSVMFFIYHRKVLKNIVSDKPLVAANQEIKKKNMLIYHSVQFKSFRSLFIWKEIFSVRTNGRKSEKIKKTLTVEILRTEIEIL